MKKTLLTLALALAAGGAQAISMTELLDDGSITVGDKLFSNWSEVYFDSSDPARTVDTDNIEVVGIDDGGDYGLRFGISNGEFNVTGDGLYAYLDYSFGFSVTVLNPNLRIKDNSLKLLKALFRPLATTVSTSWRTSGLKPKGTTSGRRRLNSAGWMYPWAGRA
jgi:hypothetical protein